MIKITRVMYTRMKKVGTSRILALCSVVLNDCIMVHGIAVRDGRDGEYITMPHQPNGESGRKKEVLHPLSRDVHLYFKNTILEGYFSSSTRLEYEYYPEDLD